MILTDKCWSGMFQYFPIESLNKLDDLDMNEGSWITKLPKVGIRPTIDGRYGGVRESLEDQVMNMAKSAADLISASLKYPNGEPVECVIADTCIGGVAESAACAEKFDAENVGVSLTVTPAWCYGSETMDIVWFPTGAE